MNCFRTLAAAIALAAISVPVASCRDANAPSAPVESPNALLGLSGGLGGGVANVVDTVVTALQRTIPLAEDVSRSATIGPEGGSIEIPEAGFRLDVPKNAVSAPTLITVTAVNGSTVAYEFEPHGITLGKRLIVSQDLGVSGIVSNLGGTSFSGAYFRSRDELRADGTVFVHELEPTTVDQLSTVRFSIGHFSGYIVGVD